MSEQLKVLDDVKSKLSGYSLEKLDKSLMKNPDLEKFTSKTNSLQFRVKISHSPLTSCEIERSFSLYKNILADKRYNLLEENIEKFLIMQFNSFVI